MSEGSDALVFFGATGDLVKKKTFPALDQLKAHARHSLAKPWSSSPPGGWHKPLP